MPRIVTASEWRALERGLAQRLTAVNLFLKDVYHDLVQSCRHYRRDMRGVHVHRDIYVSVAARDLVRLEDGRFVVLEDNLRVPSGVSYMLANREVTPSGSCPGDTTPFVPWMSREAAAPLAVTEFLANQQQ